MQDSVVMMFVDNSNFFRERHFEVNMIKLHKFIESKEGYIKDTHYFVAWPPPWIEELSHVISEKE